MSEPKTCFSPQWKVSKGRQPTPGERQAIETASKRRRGASDRKGLYLTQSRFSIMAVQYLTVSLLALVLVSASHAAPIATNSCMEHFITSTGVESATALHYAARLAEKRLSVEDLRNESSLKLTELMGPRFSIETYKDIVNIQSVLVHQGPCSVKDAFCQHGGSCVHDSNVAGHVCRCKLPWGGERCEENQDATHYGELAAGYFDLKDQISALTRATNNNGSITYTRWGKANCNTANADAKLLYSGYMSGPPEQQTGLSGSGSNYLCLPMDPIYDTFRAGEQGDQSRALVFPVEFETLGDFEPFGSKVDSDVACSACHVLGRTTQIMIPGRNVCPAGWQLEYSGYLMSEAAGRGVKTEFVCVDAQPDVLPGTGTDREGSELWLTEVKCDRDLPCPPYNAEKELTCAVCTY